MASPPRFYRLHSTITELDGESSEGVSVGGAGDGNDVSEAPAASSRQVVSTSQHIHTNLLLVALLDHLSTLYVHDENQQYQLYQALVNALVTANIMRGFGSLDEASSLRTQYKLAFSNLLSAAIATVQKKEFPNSNIHDRTRIFFGPRINMVHPLVLPTLNSIITHNTSRYHEDFRQIGRVGYGAYGSVYKVRNKLDHCEYAIKKISFESSEPELWLKIINEVKLLAQLSHKNVVRYHNAWIEYDSPSLIAGSKDELSSVPRLLPPDKIPALTYNDPNKELPDNCKSKERADCDNNQDDSIVFAEVSNGQPDPAGGHGSSDSVSDSLSSSSRNGLVSSPSSDGIEHVNGRFPRAVVVLHIQMELCRRTLKDWIQARNDTLRDTDIDKYTVVDATTNLQLLKQIVKGLSFIHSHNLMHRDIKPKNIFLSPSETCAGFEIAKVGDFGLARHAASDEEPLTPHPGRTGRENSRGPYTCGVGTTIYAAPEQLDGSNYTQKCDMYSLGLVIFEMYEPFRTEMERIEALNNLRNNVLPDGFTTRWPEQARFVRQLLSENSALRPSAMELLQSELFNSRDKVISNLRTQNSTLRSENRTMHEENEQLRKLLAKRDSEIAMLRRALVNKVTGVENNGK